jgi:acetylcholinesterase
MLSLDLILQLYRSIAFFIFDRVNMGLLTACQRLALASAVLPSIITAKGTDEVSLQGYGSFVGTTINQTLTKRALPVPVDAWLGIDYASQPVGNGRFAPAGPPTAFSGTKNATQYGFSCVQDPADIPYEQNEACLSMNVFRPQNSSSSDKLPILIWIHGVSINKKLSKYISNQYRVDSYLVVQEVSMALLS